MDANSGRAIPPLARDDELRALLAAIVDSSDDAIVSKTLDGVITSWNRGAEQLFGYTAAEAIGQQIFLIIPADRRPEEEDVLVRLRRGEKIDPFETVRRTKDGRHIHVSLMVSPIKDALGNIIGASKVARGISERRQIHELGARLAAIIDSSDDAIVTKTLDGFITSWNRGAEKIFGYPAAEAIGQHIFLIVPDDRIAEEEDVLERLRHGEKIEHFETVRRTKNGRRLHISMSVSPIKDAQGNVTGVSNVARDVTERILAQESLRHAHADLEERVRARTAELLAANEALRVEIAERHRVEQERVQLLTRVVLAQEEERRRIARELHDQLGQQLTALRLTVEALKGQSGERTELREQFEMLEELAAQLDRDVAFRVWELRPPEVDTLGLEPALMHYVRNWSKHFGIAAHMHANWPAKEPLPSELETTLYRLAQEALNNIAKHARADRVDVVLERGAESLSLIIEDNGAGFDTSADKAPGHGFGLTSMRERAALVGADLQIESTAGEGTTVIFRTPVIASATET